MAGSLTLWNPHTWPRGLEDAALVISGLAFLVPVVVILVLSRRQRLTARALRWNASLCALLLLLVNPVGQMVTLGPIDAAIRSRWQTQAAALPLVGMSPDEVFSRFGEPCQRRGESPAICGPSGCRSVGAPYTAWDYAPLSFFWLAHGFHFKIFFKNGRVSGFNPG